MTFIFLKYFDYFSKKSRIQFSRFLFTLNYVNICKNPPSTGYLKYRSDYPGFIQLRGQNLKISLKNISFNNKPRINLLT